MQLPTPRMAIGVDPPRNVPPRDRPHRPTRPAPRRMRGAVLATLMTSLLLGTAAAEAADAVLAPGDAVVSGFSGFRPSGAAVIPGTNPLDQFVINTDGASAQIQSVGVPGEPPSGQLIASSAKRQFLARDVGQVFAIALEEPREAGKTPPNIYLGATSAFGLHIVRPDADGDGQPDRSKNGTAGATWMAGMFADDKGGSPGAIWRVDGVSGETKLFATLPGNSGAGVGDVVHDKEHRQFFASDLDSGLVHRIDDNGQLTDTFDHGVAGRPAKGLAVIADDGKKADITSAAFDVEKPETWGYTQKERRVHGLAMRDGRLFYAVDRQVWSIGINTDGSFGSDARWELDVETTTPNQQLSDMLFDKDGRLYVAERGAQVGSYDFSLFAVAEKAEVKRYRLEVPDDPATPSRWIPVAESYAIGLPAEHRHSNGGITLGFDYDETGMLRIGSCGAFLWTTGERLRAGEFAQGDAEGDPAANADVHGLQGNAISLVRPQNVPPMSTYFTDYDSFFGDAEKAGHMGDVEIWQPCDGAPGVQTFGELPPWWIPPGDDVPPGFPPEFPDPEYPYGTNLELKKRANPKSCWGWGANWLCRYQIRVRNTGPDNYFGHILVRDFFPANPAGLDTAFQPQPPWACWHVGGNPANTRCWRPNVFLMPGQSVFLDVWAKVPKNPLRCHLTNVAEIEWAPGGTQWNSDPNDDLDGATAIIPDPRCKQEPKRSNLKLEKKAELCKLFGNGAFCRYHITVENTGPDNYSGPITVRDQLPTGVGFSGLPAFNWNCGGVGANTWECTHKNPANVVLAPTQRVHLWVIAAVPVDVARDLKCKLRNKAWITNPLGAPKNTDAGDDSDSATADLPDELCREKKSNLSIEKRAAGGTCTIIDGHALCKYFIRVINEGPAPYFGILRVLDTAPAGAQILVPPGPWAFDPQAGNTRLAKLNGVMMPVNSAKSFPIWLKLTQEEVRANECVIRNVAKIVAAPGGSPNNTNAGDDEDDATMNGPAEMCKRPPTPVPQQCPPGYVFDDGQCVPKTTQCPSGWTRTPVKDKCCPPGERWNGRTCSQRPIEPPGLIDPIPPVIPPVLPPLTCPFGMDQVSSLRAHYLREQGWTVRRLPGLWCVKPPRETPCPPGFEQVPQSRISVLRERGWVVRSVDHGKWCGKPPSKPETKTCPDGSKVPLGRKCPERPTCEDKGMIGKWPDCRRKEPETKTCPDGSKVPVGRKCPERPTCEGKGMTGKWPNCKPIIKRCPEGTVGKFPNCRKIVRHCPEGTVGKYPNCRKIVRPCPAGTFGKYPDCKRIVKIKPNRPDPQTKRPPFQQVPRNNNKPVIR